MKEQLTLPRARDLMSRQLQMVPPDTPLAEVVQLLLKHEVSNAPSWRDYPQANSG